MKHALSAASAALILLAGCAADHEPAGAFDFHFATSSARFEQQPVQEAALTRPQPTIASPQQRPVSKVRAPETPEASREEALRQERQVYAQGLEKILFTNGMSVSVLVYEGQVRPTPTLMFVGYFSKDFVTRALTSGAVLERARGLGFKSVDFFDRGPDGHYQFVLSKTAPLPKCATYNRLCL